MALILAIAPPVRAQDEPTLLDEQQEVARQFARLEEMFLKLSRVTASTDPARGSVLREAFTQSKQRHIQLQFEEIARLLQDGDFRKAINSQKNLQSELQALLDLLLREDRAKKLESENRRIRNYLKQLGRIIKQQEGIHGRTEGGDDPRQLADRQGEVGQRTGELRRTIEQHEEQAAATASEGEDPQNASDNQSPAESDPNGDAQPTADSDTQVDDQSNSNPVRRRLEAAEKRMRQAQRQLEEAQREGALEDQRQALQQLRQAQAELEQILRQMREEEIERTLAMLEGRFRRMLQMQIEVHESTIRLDQTPDDQRTRDHEIQSGRLSRKQRQIVDMCDRAILLLREEGTTAALPEAAEQVRDDMQQIVELLARFRVDQLTQAVERDVITSLEEIIGALQDAQQESQDRQQAGGQPGEPADPALVDDLAELRMIRSLQMRINQRTRHYGQLFDGEQAGDADVRRALAELADRQRRIGQIAREIATGKNR